MTLSYGNLFRSQNITLCEEIPIKPYKFRGRATIALQPLKLSLVAIRRFAWTEMAKVCYCLYRESRNFPFKLSI